MNTPDTPEQDELLDDVEAALEEIVRYGYNAGEAFNLVAPTIAAIRRQAAADALREAARRIEKTAAFLRQQANSARGQGDPTKAILNFEIYAARSDRAYYDAKLCRDTARDVIAEGYEYKCAKKFAPASWAGPEYGCDTPVPEAGDYCPACEPEDDDDAWAE